MPWAVCPDELVRPPRMNQWRRRTNCTKTATGSMLKIKVHPAMLLKTNKGRCQVSGARCQASPSLLGIRAERATPLDTASFRKTAGKRMWRCIENEGSSGDVDENKQRQVSGIRCQVSGLFSWRLVLERSGPSRLGIASFRKTRGKRARQCIENEGSSGYVDENKQMLVPGIRCEVSGVPPRCAVFGPSGPSRPDTASFRETGGKRARQCIENEDSSGYVDENKQRQVSGIRCEVSGVPPRCAVFGPSGPSRPDTASFRETGGKRARQCIENEGSSGYVDENKQRQVSGIRCQVCGEALPLIVSRKSVYTVRPSARDGGAIIVPPAHRESPGFPIHNSGIPEAQPQGQPIHKEECRCQVRVWN